MVEKEVEDARLETKPNPIESTNFFSKVFFCWLLPLFKHGYKNNLERNDLYQTVRPDSSTELANRLSREWELELEKEKRTGKKASLLKALIRTFRFLVILNGFIIFFEECIFKMAQPILLGILVQYFNASSNITTTQAYLCALGMSLCAMGITIFHHPSFFISSRVGMRIRIAVSALVYRKALKLNNSALGKTTVGQLVNILSNDVNRFDMSIIFIHYIWIAPIQVAIMLVVLSFQMGLVCLVALFTLLLLVPVQAFMGKMFSQLRAKTALLTDERVRIMNEIISGMRIIKIHAWEGPFTDLIEEARRKEILRIQKTSVLRAFNLSFFFMSSKVVAYTTFTVFAATGNLLVSSVVFVAMPMFDIVRLTVTLFAPYCSMYTLEGLVSVKRIQKFLNLEELADSEMNLDEATENQHFTFVDNVQTHSTKETQVNFGDSGGDAYGANVKENGQAMIVVDGHLVKPAGSPSKPVGSHINKNGDLYTLKVKDLSGSWDAEAQTSMCLREVSFTVKPGELVAIIGPVGCGKSSLFMALLGELPHITGDILFKGKLAYTSQQPWVYSGTLKENILFGRPYDKVRYEKTLSVCALKKDIAILPDGDLTLIGERGVTLSGGQRARVSLARTVYVETELILLDDPLSAVDTVVGRHLFDRCIKGHLKSKSVILITHQLQYLNAVDKIVVLKEGKMVDCGTYEELQTHGIDFALLLKEYEDEDENIEKLSRAQSLTSRGSDVASPEDVDFDDELYTEVEDKETKVVGTVSSGVYSQYILAGTRLLPFFIFMVFNLAAQIFFVLSDWLIAEWSFVEESCSEEFEDDVCLYNSTVLNDFTNFNIETAGRAFFFYIYTAFLVMLIIFGLIRTRWLFVICVNASKTLHNKMLAAIIRTSMQFFDTNPVGRILNRFSKDIGFMDELLPITIADFNQIMIQTVAVLITVSIFNPIVLIFTVPLVILFVIVRAYYLSSSRDIKRIEGVCRSPVFSHLSSTLQGLTTVRAFHAQDRFIAKFDMYQDIHTESWFTFLASTRWFGIMLDWLSTSFLVVVAFSSVLSKDILGLDAAAVGLSLTYALSLMGSFQWGVRQSAEVENLMTSTERVIEYSQLKSEAALGSKDTLDPKWPEEGAIQFHDVSLRYAEDAPMVLKGINMSIAPREKIGIVGRTGAGKSSLTVVLMRLVEPIGHVTIDGINLSDIGLHDVRNKISFIPQDPTLFSGTLRSNLDPFSEHDDDSLWKVLEEVQLQPVIEEIPEKLEMKMAEGGNNFSVGQRQLLCLARAMLRKNRVLLVDEATANVDVRTDQLIQATIREKFQDCTVLTIAHRLVTIMDSDKVLVLEEGKIIEYDEPYTLLLNPAGDFSRMVAETGSIESAKLIQIAKGKFLTMQRDDSEQLLGNVSKNTKEQKELDAPSKIKEVVQEVEGNGNESKGDQDEREQSDNNILNNIELDTKM